MNTEINLLFAMLIATCKYVFPEELYFDWDILIISTLISIVKTPLLLNPVEFSLEEQALIIQTFKQRSNTSKQKQAEHKSEIITHNIKTDYTNQMKMNMTFLF